MSVNNNSEPFIVFPEFGVANTNPERVPVDLNSNPYSFALRDNNTYPSELIVIDSWVAFLNCNTPLSAKTISVSGVSSSLSAKTKRPLPEPSLKILNSLVSLSSTNFMCGAAFVPVAAISNLPVGLVVPIPTFCDESTLNASEPPVTILYVFASLKPK